MYYHSLSADPLRQNPSPLEGEGKRGTDWIKPGGDIIPAH
jgi:hypothetical protein